jgi:carbamate kinase
MAYLDGMQERFAVIALGGNAILRKGQTAEPATQMKNLREAVNNLTPAIDRYKSFAVTHGNGPQVGFDLIRSSIAHDTEGIPELGLADCVANTQGRIGHWLLKEFKNNPKFRMHPVASILTHVYVEKYKFSPDEYTKYVGPWIPNTESNRAKLDSQKIRYKVPPGQTEKLRRVVPSPIPYKIEEFEIIASLMAKGAITICCGGGGIPIYDGSRNGEDNSPTSETFKQVDVVIDKDRASALLAVNILEFIEGSDVELVILMDARGLFRDARCRDRDFIPQMTLSELNEFISTTKLDSGTIGPKLEAIQFFLESGGRRAYLGPLSDFPEVFDPDSGIGTIFLQSPQLGLYR